MSSSRSSMPGGRGKGVNVMNDDADEEGEVEEEEEVVVDDS